MSVPPWSSHPARAPAQAGPAAAAAPEPRGQGSACAMASGQHRGATEVLPSRVHNSGPSEPEKGQGKGNAKAQSALEAE